MKGGGGGGRGTTCQWKVCERDVFDCVILSIELRYMSRALTELSETVHGYAILCCLSGV